MVAACSTPSVYINPAHTHFMMYAEPTLVMCVHASNHICQTVQGDNKGFLVCKKKMVTSAELLCRYTPPAFRQVTDMHL